MPTCFGQQSEASLEDTTAFLKSKILGSKATGDQEGRFKGCSWYISQSESNDRFEVKQCSIIASHTSLLLLQVTEGRCMAPSPEVQVPSTSVLEFSLANLAVNSTKVDEYPAFLETESYKPPIYRVVLRFSEPVNPFPGSHRTKPYKEWSFAMRDKEMADRVLRAFNHAAVLCGAKKEVF